MAVHRTQRAHKGDIKADGALPELAEPGTGRSQIAANGAMRGGGVYSPEGTPIARYALLRAFHISAMYLLGARST